MADRARGTGFAMGSHDQMPLLSTLKRAAAALREADIPFALCGGYAAYARGAGAPHHDVDFLILEADTERGLDALASIGMRTERPPEDWLVKAWDPVELPDGSGPEVGAVHETLVDLVFRPAGRAVTPDLLADIEHLEVAAVRMPVISATQLVVSKLLAFSPHGCDFAEALPMARALREQIDWPRVRKETAESPYAFAFLVLLEKLDVIAPEEIHEP